MNIKEMHVEVHQATQNIAAAVKRKLLPDELDWLLNKGLERFIQSKVKTKKDGSGGYEIDQVDVDAIRTLMVTTELIAAVDADNRYMAQLPGDYAYLISDGSRTLNLCGTAPTGLVSNSSNILKLKLSKSTKVGTPWFGVLNVTVGADTIEMVAKIADEGIAYTGLPGNGSVELGLVRDVLMWNIRNILGYKVYWERYKNIYAPNTFLIPGEAAGELVIDATTIPGTVVTEQITQYSTTTGKFYANRLMPSNKISPLLRTAFYQPSYLSPISELEGNQLIIYADSSFIVNRVAISYVKKPRRLSLVMGQSCDLAPEFHNAVCDLTVEYFKAMTADPNWQVKLQDNLMRTLPIQ